MALINLKELKRLFHPHYILNILLALAYFITKTFEPLCTILHPTTGCRFDFRESEFLTFLAIIIVFKTRKQGTTSVVPFLSAACMYTKLANLALFFLSDPRMGLVFAVLCLIHMLVFPEPPYTGPDHVIYFRDTSLEEEIQQDKRVTWLVAFYAAWSPPCVAFAPIFAELSLKYTLDNLKFGKLDASRYPAFATKYHISTSSFTKQLPTVILFRHGKEVSRRPTVDSKGKLIKFFFTEDNVTSAFDLNNLYQECKENPLKKKKDAVPPIDANHTKVE